MGGLRELIALFHEAAEAYPGKTKALAGDLDKRPSTLFDELNPALQKTGQGKLGAEDALEIMRLTGDNRPLEYMAAHLGFTLRPMTEHLPDGKDMAHECLQGLLAVAKFAEAARDGMAFSDLSPLLEDAIIELQDVWKRARDEQSTRPSRTRKSS